MRPKNRRITVETASSRKGLSSLCMDLLGLNKVVSEKDLLGREIKEHAVTFLDSLLLGEEELGRIVCKEVCSATMSLPVKPMCWVGRIIMVINKEGISLQRRQNPALPWLLSLSEHHRRQTLPLSLPISQITVRGTTLANTAYEIFFLIKHWGLTTPHINLLRNWREIEMKRIRRDIAQGSQEALARIRVEHFIGEENMVAAHIHVPIINTQR